MLLGVGFEQGETILKGYNTYRGDSRRQSVWNHNHQPDFLFFKMLSSNMMPVMMPRPAPIFQQSPFSIGMYPSAVMFHPSQLFPPPPSRDAFSANPLKMGYLPSSPPPLKPQAFMSSPNFQAHSSGSPSPPMMMKSPSSSSYTRGSPSPPCSPDSASSSSSGGEKTAFTIDAILSSNKRTPSSSSHAGSSRSGYGSDRRLTPSPDSYNFVSPKSTSPSKIWNASRFQAPDFRYGAEGVKKTSEYHFDSHCDPKLSSAMSATSEERLISTAADSMRNCDVTKDKSLKRLRCDESEWNPKAKRVRTIFTQEQLERLEKEFDRQQYMVGSERLYLAAELSLSESQVKVWFQNRRIKWRKQNFEKQQIQLAHIRTVHDTRYDGDQHSSEDDDELLNDHVSPSSSTMPRDDTHNRVGSAVLENSDAMTSSTTHPSLAQGSGEEFNAQRETTDGASLTSPNAASTTVSFSAALQLEVKKVEERLAMRLCRRSMVQASSSLPSSSSPATSLSSASHLRLMSSIRRMESSHDIEYQKRD